MREYRTLDSAKAIVGEAAFASRRRSIDHFASDSGLPSAKSRTKPQDIKEQWLANKIANEEAAGQPSAMRGRTWNVKAYKHVFDRALPIFY